MYTPKFSNRFSVFSGHCIANVFLEILETKFDFVYSQLKQLEEEAIKMAEFTITEDDLETLKKLCDKYGRFRVIRDVEGINCNR